MSNLTHLFKVGQKVTYRNNDFDAVKRNIPCIVKETYPDHIIITDTETDTDLWIEEGFNMDCVYVMNKTYQRAILDFILKISNPFICFVTPRKSIHKT